MIQLARVVGGIHFEIKTSIWNVQGAASCWHSYKKSGFQKRRYVVDSSSTKVVVGRGGARGKGRSPRMGRICLLRLRMKTDLGMRDPPKIHQPPKCLSYPLTTATWRMKLNPVERVDFFDIMQCLGEKKKGGGRYQEKNSSFSQRLAKLFLAFNDTSHHRFMGSFERCKGGAPLLCNPFQVGN
ncbi:hypothetical protein HJG60_008153 [Phyllostomus discolor]|uniref:Uncharacterized protein n=1 Tax=Phyllostomus discolor TaxID=89673 RepID=A0A834DSG4_9CHIR|nr:hypothetical protein HJG60_008153 [Phyllostomus discolor]